MKLRNTIIALVFSAFAASTLAAGGMEGQTAPDFALKSSTGENLRLSEYRGDMTVIIATSRPSYYKVANRVFDMADGRLSLTEPSEPKEITEPASQQMEASA